MEYYKYITRSDFMFNTGFILFYQHNFNNIFFARAGACCNFTVAKNTFSFLSDTISEKLTNANFNINLNLKHLFDVGGLDLIL